MEELEKIDLQVRLEVALDALGDAAAEAEGSRVGGTFAIVEDALIEKIAHARSLITQCITTLDEDRQ
jgi:hypothetical protein